ncbi:MAG: ABC transporter permease [Syntrophaceae bacterium]|nr:ABC transporter permease [Syntrophaceae bacterium]
MMKIGATIKNWKEEKESWVRNLKLTVYTLSRSPLSVIGFILVFFFLTVALIGPLIITHPEDVTGAVHMDRKLHPPSLAYPFGTDEMGRDLYSRVVMGTRISLQIGLIIIFVAMGIGIPLGITAGYMGGWMNEIIMRITDVFLAVPGLLLALAIVGALGPGIANAMIALSIVWWPGYVRLVQGKTLALREEAFVEAARSLGVSRVRIIFSHILPNCTSPIMVKASMDMGMAILFAASLGFIGVGAQPPEPEWGAIISIGRNYLPERWWMATFPGLAILVTVLGFNLLGDGLRDVLDPQSRG